MSFEEVVPSDLFPIKDVNCRKVQEAARFAVEWKNKGGHRLIYKRVVNGLSDNTDSHAHHQYYILVIEAINDDGIPWSYIAKVKHFGGNGKEPHVFSVEDVLKNYKKH
ncbi:uncharacterized protein LOC111433339 isoform X3 [Cucurbita moschata]|uniref:Uncharacterized protein LOC111433339 isoform X3 n=1 Tax=Cucurbita moschata TaxID=3662 RepID=A0A6J1EDQ1_CUCMO|nr:uncharacterized protein LOC111433339 isoform X3 [Cucurbita moschata]